MRIELISREPASGPAGQPLLLFVHGAWHGAWCWEEHFLPFFAAQGFSAHALSLRGHGASERPHRFKTMRVAQYVADVVQVVARFPTPPVLIGHSMGGLVVQKYLERHPASGAVLLASVPPRGVLRTTLAIAGRHPLRFVRGNLTWSLLPIVDTLALTREAFFTPTTDDTIVRAALQRIQDESYWAFLDMIAFSLPRPGQVLRRPVPVLVLGAAGDGIFTPAEIRLTARAYHTEAELFPSMGHDMMLDGGWQAVADRILSWLRGHF